MSEQEVKRICVPLRIANIAHYQQLLYALVYELGKTEEQIIQLIEEVLCKPELLAFAKKTTFSPKKTPIEPVRPSVPVDPARPSVQPLPSAVAQEVNQVQRVLGLLAGNQVELAVDEANQMPRGLARDQMLLSSLPRLAKTDLQKAKELAYTISSVELDRVALGEILAIEEELIKKVESEISDLIARNEFHQAVDRAFLMPRGEARDRLLAEGLMWLVRINAQKAWEYAQTLSDKILRETILREIEPFERDQSARRRIQDKRTTSTRTSNTTTCTLASSSHAAKLTTPFIRTIWNL